MGKGINVTEKVVSLKHAIENSIEPGMTLHIGLEAGAAACELARQFWECRPDFTLIMNMIGGHHALGLIHGGLVKKLIFATCADIYPRPYPNAVIQRAFNEKSVELENWSMLSLTQSLMAGALNLPFTTTRSLIGSDLAKDNQDTVAVVKDQFGSGEKIALIKSLNPDVSLVHGWVADPAGNTILSVPPREAWAAKASKKGVIVTVEKVVSEDFIRKHSSLVKIPGSLVNAVCVVPNGAHPQSMNSQHLPEFEGYGLDHAYLKSFSKAGRDSGTFDRWVKDWILDCTTHQDYQKKMSAIRGCGSKSGTDLQSDQSKKVAEPINLASKTPTSSECAIICGARKIKEIVVDHGYKTMFAGIGISGLAGWCAYYFLKDKGYHIDLIAAGIGYEPCPGDPLLISAANIATAKMISDSIDLHGAAAGGINSRCLGVLGAGQIDKYGNINSTIIKTSKGKEIYLTGAGGGNDIASVAEEVVAVAVNRANRLVEKVHYITSPGTRISTLITDEGTYGKEGSEFILTGYFPNAGVSENRGRIKEISNACGWDLRISPELEKLSPPTEKELNLLRSFDPEGVFLR
jgi:acyl CoA:acetate/3-ketoacid CoA transferase alpha subunit/acyl CoA:acetate/3-ketoacid CoA transferase beta subunit